MLQFRHNGIHSVTLGSGHIVTQQEAGRNMHRFDREEVIAEFIRIRGVTRCPTACVSPTQASVGAADRAALEEHAIARDRSRQAKTAARMRPFWPRGCVN
jgi:hypothetical protein